MRAMASPAARTAVALPAPTGFTTSQTTPAARDPPDDSHPPSSTGSNRIFRTGLNFDRDNNTPRQPSHLRRPPSPGGGPDEEPANDDERAMRRLIKGIQGARLEGNFPKPFEGDRRDSKRFLIVFNRYYFMNHKAGIIRDPFNEWHSSLVSLTGKLLLGLITPLSRW